MASFSSPKVPSQTLATSPDLWKNILPHLIILLGIWIETGGWIWTGALFIVIGIGVYGNSLPDRDSLNFVPEIGGESRWVSVTPTEVARIKTKLAALDKTSSGFVTGLSGCSLVIGAFGCFFLGALPFRELGSRDLSAALGSIFPNLLLIGGAVLFLGTPSIWRPDRIVFKLPVLEKIMGWVNTLGGSTWSKEYQLELRKAKKGEVPVDIKLCLKPPDCPADFYGIQGQVSQNRGQPYVYFCVIAKQGNQVVKPPAKVTVPGEEMGFFGNVVESLTGYKDREVYETKQDAQVNVLVIRQYADKTGGYITSDSDIKRLLVKSLKSGEATVKQMPKAS